MYSGNGKNRNHSGEGHFVENIIVFVVLMAILVAGFYATSYAGFADADGQHGVIRAWLPMIAVIGGGVISYGVAMAMGRGTDNHPDRTANEAAAENAIEDEYSQALTDSARRR